MIYSAIPTYSVVHWIEVMNDPSIAIDDQRTIDNPLLFEEKPAARRRRPAFKTQALLPPPLPFPPCCPCCCLPRGPVLP